MDEKIELRCSFCDKTDSEVEKLIAGPAVYICGDCAERYLNYRLRSDDASSLVQPGHVAQSDCSFCGKSRVKVDWMVQKGDHRICNECLSICEEILAES